MNVVMKRSPRARLSGALQVVVVTSAALLYFAVRGMTVGDSDVAAQNAQALVSWEIRLGLHRELGIQDLVEQSQWLTMLMNWVYIWGHWPVIIVALLWLVRQHPDGYRVTRNAMLLSGGFALGVFAVYPMAPPRLAGLGFVDTVTEYSTSYRVLQPNALVNQYAAMPSLHVGWNLLIGIALIRYAAHLLVRAAGAVLPVLMVVSVIATGNHYIADAVAGIALVLVCLVLASQFERVERRHPRPAAGTRAVMPAVSGVNGNAHPPRLDGLRLRRTAVPDPAVSAGTGFRWTTPADRRDPRTRQP